LEIPVGFRHGCPNGPPVLFAGDGVGGYRREGDNELRSMEIVEGLLLESNVSGERSDVICHLFSKIK
jgi:hypothetical protein